MPTETQKESNGTEPLRRTYTGRSAFLSYFVSFAIHVVILVGLALGAVNKFSDFDRVLSISTVSDPQDQSVDFGVDSSSQAPAPISSTEQQVAVASSFEGSAAIEIELSEVEPSFESTSVSWKGELAKAVARDGAKKSGLSLAGSGSSFFGIESPGEKFVFIVDSSRSMTGTRWEHANKELFRSLSELGPDQKFFVICFDYAAHPAFNLMPGNINFLSPSNSSRRRIRQWIQTLGLGSHTRPAEALKMALALQPDAIYLLSDGELEDDSYDMLAIINHDPKTGKTIIPVHTISLYSTSGRELLELIASNNGGKFVNID